MSRDDLLHAILALPRSERALMARELARSLADDLSGEQWAEAWGNELNRRIADVEAGVGGVSFNDVLAELEEAGGRQAS